MKYLAAAIVTTTILAGAIIEDMGYMRDSGQGWNSTATLALSAFTVILFTTKDK